MRTTTTTISAHEWAELGESTDPAQLKAVYGYLATWELDMYDEVHIMDGGNNQLFAFYGAIQPDGVSGLKHVIAAVWHEPTATDGGRFSTHDKDIS